VVDDVRLTALVSCVWRGVMGEAGRDVLRRVVGLTVTYEASSEEWETRMELQSEGFITASELRRTQSV
jgi:5-methylthioribose kinase